MSETGQPSPDYFDRAYRDYKAQNPPAKLDHYLHVVRSNTPRSTPRLLDVGCGRGLFLQRVHEQCADWDLAGLDVEPRALSIASDSIPTATISFGQADSIPFPSSSFDVITAWDVLEHLSDVESALSEIGRCLSPGGLLATAIPVYDGVTGPLIRRLDRDPTHVHKQARGYWIDLIASRFTDVDWHGIYRFMVTSSLYVHIPTRLLRRATPAVLITAHKRRGPRVPDATV